MAYNQYYTMLKKPSRKKLIKQCNTFLSTTICKKNLQLKNIVESEINKLKCTMEINLVITAIQSLNTFYCSRYPEISKIERAVKISEALHHLSIYQKKPFMTLVEANRHAYDNFNAFKSGRKVIYGRLKKYLKSLLST